jgi:DNA-binding FadR family transcriptional regulator
MSGEGAAGTAAVHVAQLIQQEIVRQGWPVGAMLGSEPALCERYEVGRAVIREAARILEVRGIAHRRRGPGGGLIVDEPDPEQLVGSVELFLDHRGVAPEQLFETWAALAVVVVADVAATLDECGVERLRAAVAVPPPTGRTVRIDELHDVHRDIAELCSNPATGLFLRVVLSLCRDYGYDEVDDRTAAWIHRSKRELVEAIIAGDGPRAQFLARRYIDRLAAMGAVRSEAERTGAAGSANT